VTLTVRTDDPAATRGADRLAAAVRGAGWDARLAPCDADDVARMRASADTVARHLAADEPIYGLTQGFGPLVLYGAESELEQGSSLISHLGTGQGRPLAPEVTRLVLWLRLTSMRRGFSAVSPAFWQILADLWNGGFTPVVPRDGTVSASGDLQPLAHAALAYTGFGEAWLRTAEGTWTTQPAARALAALGVTPFEWPVREALAFVNGTGVSLAVSILNQRSAVRLVRAGAALTGRLAALLGANPEHYHDGHALARGQVGQLTAARWIRSELPPDAAREPDRPLQEPYSLRCAPQVLGAVLDQLDAAGEILAREVSGSTDNPITFDGRVLHGGNFHAMPNGLASDQIGLALHMAAYLAERQLGLLLSPATNGGLPMMLTPRAGRGCGLAGVQISATSFVARIRQLVYPASLTTLPTNGWNQDHVPMALNGANSVADAIDLGWLAIGSLALGVAQLATMAGHRAGTAGVWAELAGISPPLAADRPMAAEVRAARDLMDRYAAELIEEDDRD
jgi:histidine ammonia-lyase